MTTSFPCPFLRGEVELTGEREAHIAARHPDLLPEHRQLLALTLADPDLVRQSPRFGQARLFSRWSPEVRDGKHLVVVVVSQEGGSPRHWIITAYLTRRLAAGDILWKRN
jgi:hypothetical protein